MVYGPSDLHNQRVTASRRSPALLAALGLLVSGLAVVAATVLSVTPASSASGEIFAERWCSQGKPAPCVVSATRNGVAMSPDDPELEIVGVSTIYQPNAYDTAMWFVQRIGGMGQIPLNDTYTVQWDLGTLRPDTARVSATGLDVDRIDDGDGTYQAQVTGRPVLIARGCVFVEWPPQCPETATSNEVRFGGEFWQEHVNTEFIGMEVSGNVGSNGIFLKENGDDPDTFSSDIWGPHYLADGATLNLGALRYRLPYSLLKSDFAIPDPASVVASSIDATLNGKPFKFKLTQDPDGGGIIIDIEGVTFSRKKVELNRGDITPTRPKLKSAARAGIEATLKFRASESRGAKVKRYQARCTGHGSVLTATATKKSSRVVVTGLRAGQGYSCQVRAGSRAGYGAWSKTKQV